MQQTFLPNKQYILTSLLIAVIGFGYGSYLVLRGQFFSGLFFTLISACIGYRSLQLNIAISIDEDGLWLTKKGKENSLIKWESIVELHEPLFPAHSLDLHNKNHERLLRINYTMINMKALWETIVQYAMLSDKIQTTFNNRDNHWLAEMFLALVFVTPSILFECWFSDIELTTRVIVHSFAVLGLGVCLNAYRRKIRQLVITKSCIELSYLFKKQSIQFSHIESVKIVSLNELNTQYFFPVVHITLGNKEKNIRLFQVGHDPVTLQRNIQRAIDMG